MDAGGSVVETVVHGYGAAAASLLDQYDAIDPAQLYGAMLDLFPGQPVRFADIGAGTGRDAAWLAAQGHRVTAVEPVAAFRTAGARRYPTPSITWCDDRLPALRTLTGRGRCFGGVLLSERPVIAGDPDHTIAAARAAGFSLLRRTRAASIGLANRQAEVSWTCLALARG